MNFNKFFLHPKEEYKFICLENHQCQKKLCPDCLCEHRPQRFETINKFLSQKNTAIAKSLNQIQYQTFLKTLDSLIQDLKALNPEYLDIKQKLIQKNIEAFSNIELQLLTEIGLPDQISDYNIFQQICIDKIFHNALELFQQQKQDNTFILSKISSKNEVVETQELFDLMHCQKKRKIGQINLIGEKIFGMMHGEYYYQIENNEKVLKKGGMYFLDQKIGQWSELNQNVVFEGRFVNGKKVGKWKLSFNGLSFECQYNNIGQKNGKCQDIIVHIFNSRCIIKSGNYNQGVKINNWKTYYLSKIKNLQTIGGGNYDENGQKIGKWIDINESGFENCKQIIWLGQYQVGAKFGEWKISFRSDDRSDFKYLGGGKYNQNGQKIGKWIDINQSEFTKYSQIIWKGEYQAGVKVGEWKISSRSDDRSDFKQLGGGKYDENGQKIGIWIDINESEFKSDKQIIWHGDYNEDVKVGQWKISFRSDDRSDFKYIGGGKYNENGQKIGKWIDINESEFTKYRQIIWQGEYQAGVKVGEWKSSFSYDRGGAAFIQIGGGKYDVNGLKIDQWININESEFTNDKQILWEEEGNIINRGKRFKMY